MRIEDRVPGHTSECKVVDIGVDWLTLTSNREAPQHDLTLNSWYDVFGRIRQDTGMVEEAHLLGYAGLKTEGMFLGTRYDGAMVRLSGTVARDRFLALARSGASATRLDVQVTCFWKGTGLHPPRLVALHAGSANELLPKTRQRNVEERKDNRGGYTTYIGSRQSSSFLRCYHKSAQDPEAYGSDVYRYEVQFNKDSADRVLDALHHHQDTLESACVAIVWDWCERRGIIPVFRRSAERIIVSRETIPLTEVDKKLVWLYAQVRPTVGTLVQQGWRKEAIIALLGADLGKEVNHFLSTQLMQSLEERGPAGVLNQPMPE